MEFKPGQNIIRQRGKTYVKDAIQTLVDPPKPVVPAPKPTPKKVIKPKKDESIQREQMVEKPISKGSKPVRGKSGPSIKSNKPSDSRS
tara:strand:+ start:1081 stop:1344 length:264 start_codon:yes stop_codon:yes gene_type:complete